MIELTDYHLNEGNSPKQEPSTLINKQLNLENINNKHNCATIKNNEY